MISFPKQTSIKEGFICSLRSPWNSWSMTGSLFHGLSYDPVLIYIYILCKLWMIIYIHPFTKNKQIYIHINTYIYIIIIYIYIYEGRLTIPVSPTYPAQLIPFSSFQTPRFDRGNWSAAQVTVTEIQAVVPEAVGFHAWRAGESPNIFRRAHRSQPEQDFYPSRVLLLK